MWFLHQLDPSSPAYTMFQAVRLEGPLDRAALEDGLNGAPRSEGVPIASLETIVVMKLLAGRTQDLADVEAIIASGADRELLIAAVQKMAPERADTLAKLFGNVDRSR